MNRTLSALVAGSLLFSANLAFAQGNMAGPNPKGGGMNTTMTCQGMMDKAMPMMNSMAAGSKKTMAMKEMDMAKSEMTKKNEMGCQTHMKSAMTGMGM